MIIVDWITGDWIIKRVHITLSIARSKLLRLAMMTWLRLHLVTNPLPFVVHLRFLSPNGADHPEKQARNTGMTSQSTRRQLIREGNSYMYSDEQYRSNIVQ